MQNRRRFLTLLLAVSLAFAFTACWRKKSPPASSQEESAPSRSESEPPVSSAPAPSKPTPAPEPEPESDPPEKTVRALLDAAKKWDLEQANQCLSGTALESFLPEAMRDSVSRMTAQMTYTLGDAAVKGNAATVEVEITSVDIESAFGDVMRAVAAYVTKQTLLGRKVDDPDAVLTVVNNAIDVDALPSKKYPVTVHLAKDAADEWKIDLSDSRNLPLLNALSGGLVDFSQRANDQLSEYGIHLF